MSKTQPTSADMVAKLNAMPAGESAPNPVNFYSTSEMPFGCFSNFFAAPIVINKITFPTTEHYFQAMKFVDSKKDFDDVVACTNCMDVTKIGRDRSRPLRKDWEAVKVDVMFDALTAKYLQHEDLYVILMKGCKGKTIVEHTKNDSFWGDGGDGSGKNMLGISLMKLRDLLESTTEAQRKAINTTLTESGVNPLRASVAAAAAKKSDDDDSKFA